MLHKDHDGAMLKAGPDDGLEEGQFLAYASVFGNRDSYGDVVEPGAFTKSLTDWRAKGAPIPLLFGHNMEDPDFNIGHVVMAEEDGHGLKVLGQLDLESPKGRQVHRMLKGRRVGNLSFAYDVLDSKPAKSAELGEYVSLKSLALHEISVVTVGANRSTAVLAVKGGDATNVTKDEVVMSVSLKDQRAGVVTKAQAIVDGAKAEGVELTAEQAAELDGLVDQVKAFDEQIKASLDSQALVAAVEALGKGIEPAMDQEKGNMNVSTKGRFLGLTGKSGAEAATKLAGQMLGSAGGVKSLTAAGSSVTGVPLVAQSPIELDRVPTSVLEVLGVVTHSTPEYTYLRQTVRTNNAAPWASGNKPESRYAVESVPGKLTVIPHVSEGIDRYTLIDNAALGDFLKDEMIDGLMHAVEAQVLSGNGTGVNMRGVLNTSGVLSQAFTTDLVTTTRKAVTALETGGRKPGVFVLSPTDWEALELARNTSGAFDLAHSAVDRSARKLHGVPVVVSTALPAKVAMLMDLDAVKVDTDTHGLVVEWGVKGDDFGQNASRLLVEGRFGVSVLRPTGVVKIATAA
ncbi:HK97 family phage prohead protease [Rhodococcus maanshanensis]|uniref:Phage prohead protease, HK97 family/phage major capsid protein, HK97 family,TIGR01554 n=1 Tax=Rhodococcus maanshanensis TaxID=183556 RepID=A0A1H7NMW7_9NOCA|nr:HK97 family phage prohead protease [Rhodococcus maanshanensis]SEL24741.1 phage prohead protease, HK97 family/phage major capsid protein, HK97 family,TIGR01554 [Rhodococcus maanshanensis]